MSPRPRARSPTRRYRSSAPTAIRGAATAAPSLGFSVSVPYSDRFDPLTYVEGGPPESADQAVIDKASAEDEGFEVGDTVTIAGRAGTGEYTLGGIATLGDVDSFGGATIAVLTLPEAQRLTGKEGEFDQISVAAAEGVSPDRLAASLQAALPDDLDVETGAQNVESQRDDISEFTGFIKTALLIFAGIALFVGAFLIFNTFSITVAQRTREFAMLRTLGASRRQILVQRRAGGGRDRPRRRRGRGRARDRLREGDQRPVRGARP